MMLRIGRKFIDIFSGVDVKIDGNVIIVKGLKGIFIREIYFEMIVKIENN